MQSPSAELLIEDVCELATFGSGWHWLSFVNAEASAGLTIGNEAAVVAVHPATQGREQRRHQNVRILSKEQSEANKNMCATISLQRPL